jgi:hypothetical protein
MFEQGRQVNRQTALRDGNIITLPAQGSLVITGDLHGHRRNFDRIVTFAALDKHPDRHVLLQEIIHGGPEDERGGCLSYEALLAAIEFKLQFPEQVHLIMGNHDTAFIRDAEVMKDSREMNRALYQAMEWKFGDQWTAVRDSMRDFLRSQPLALRTGNRLWMSHSLPADRLVEEFDAEVLHRELVDADLAKPGGVYILTWGRRMSQPLLDRMARLFDVDLFILGHQPQPEGWGRAGENAIILACDHNHGCILPVKLDRNYSLDGLVNAIIPLSAIA